MKNGVKIHLHINGAIVFALALAIYAEGGYSWKLFAALILAPDLFILGYLSGPKWGALVYNLGHSLIIPGVLLGIGMVMGVEILKAIGIIWAAHIGIDHLFGYGYKYPESFKATHLERV